MNAESELIFRQSTDGFVKYAPELEVKFRTLHKKPVGSSWRMDETYVKIKGLCHYLYRAVDKEGNTIDFMIICNRTRNPYD